jgi:hypothetical protein
LSPRVFHVGTVTSIDRDSILSEFTEFAVRALGPSVASVAAFRNHAREFVLFQVDGSERLWTVLFDSGCGHCIMNRSVARALSLVPTPPTDSRVRIALADPSVTLQQEGHVEVNITAHYTCGDIAPRRFRQTFQIMDIAYDFFVGTDMMEQILPLDRITDFFMPMSLLGSRAIALPSVANSISPAVLKQYCYEQENWTAMRALGVAVDSLLSLPPTTLEDASSSSSSSTTTASSVSTSVIENDIAQTTHSEQ